MNFLLSSSLTSFQITDASSKLGLEVLFQIVFDIHGETPMMGKGMSDLFDRKTTNKD